MSTDQPQLAAAGVAVMLEPYVVQLVHDYRDLYRRWQTAQDLAESQELGTELETLTLRMAYCLDLALEKIEDQQGKVAKAG